jgi:hypothetical protein
MKLKKIQSKKKTQKDDLWKQNSKNVASPF